MSAFVHCPACGERLPVPAGQQVTCDRCGLRFGLLFTTAKHLPNASLSICTTLSRAPVLGQMNAARLWTTEMLSAVPPPGVPPLALRDAGGAGGPGDGDGDDEGPAETLRTLREVLADVREDARGHAELLERARDPKTHDGPGGRSEGSLSLAVLVGLLERLEHIAVREGNRLAGQVQEIERRFRPSPTNVRPIGRPTAPPLPPFGHPPRKPRR